MAFVDFVDFDAQPKIWHFGSKPSVKVRGRARIAAIERIIAELLVSQRCEVLPGLGRWHLEVARSC
jgi:hypothetical protein